MNEEEKLIANASQEKDATHGLIAIKKRPHKKALITIVITAVCLSAIFAALYYFPVYRIINVQRNYFNRAEVSMLAYIGSHEDRVTAQSILRQADEAFTDCRHTAEENTEKYGLLSIYSTPSERGASFAAHSLELWSAHLDETEGDLWVFYSHKAYDGSGNIVWGSSEVPALWHVEKNADGHWVVTAIKEHP